MERIKYNRIDGITFTFTWNPAETSSTSFNFDGVLGYTGTLTSSNQLTPLAGTTVSVSGTAYDNVDNTITAIFSNTQIGTPTLDTCLNGTVSNISGQELLLHLRGIQQTHH